MGAGRQENSWVDKEGRFTEMIRMADLDASLTECSRRGGVVVAGPRDLGGGRFAVIRDPAGAVAALYQAPPPEA